MSFAEHQSPHSRLVAISYVLLLILYFHVRLAIVATQVQELYKDMISVLSVVSNSARSSYLRRTASNLSPFILRLWPSMQQHYRISLTSNYIVHPNSIE